MCHSRWMQRRTEEEERRAREVWEDFERTAPATEPEQPLAARESAPAEASEEVVAAER